MTLVFYDGEHFVHLYWQSMQQILSKAGLGIWPVARLWPLRS
jgi:hypothetical protein